MMEITRGVLEYTYKVACPVTKAAAELRTPMITKVFILERRETPSVRSEFNEI